MLAFFQNRLIPGTSRPNLDNASTLSGLQSIPAPQCRQVIFLSKRKILDFIKMLMEVISG